ncbi:MAG: alpha-amylase family glycosyl hydrolase [Actinomycetota bacterium]
MTASEQEADAAPEPLGLIEQDPWLAPYESALRYRVEHFHAARARIEAEGGLLGPISRGHEFFGFNRGTHRGAPGLWYREWAPGADALYLVGDFNHWDRAAHPLERGAGGVWSIFLPDAEHGASLTHGSRLKVHVVSGKTGLDRLPAYARRVVQEPGGTDFAAQLWLPQTPYEFQHPSPAPGAALRIYEAHVGMAQEEGKVGSFDEFRLHVLPRIERLGYNAVQLMAVMEHPYYGSFGYHVGSFFGVSSRFGTPEDLKRLIDDAHGRGLAVLLDLVHSHAVSNVHEGLNRFDGTDYQYFHSGDRGRHPGWDSLLFDYARPEVQQFLLSNVRYWLDEYRFDGFRFDGVTSMLYLDHGMRAFSSYADYFGENVDEDAVTYLMLANELAHTLRPDAVTIAEDVSGMPGMARPVSEGGLGFDYRLAMGVPDFWIRLLKEKRDEEWSVGEIYHVLLNRRAGEKHVGYSESHDQALVGDQTLAFRLMDSEMYWRMDRASESLIVERGIALHKLIRLVTFALAGEAYLNFMGNEFGHPEWVDFPREGNNYSYQHARRQWSLADNPLLRYQDLERFDQAMQDLDETYGLLSDPLIEQLAADEAGKVLVFRRGPLVFAFNFHATQSFADLRIPVPDAVDYQLILDSDASEFSGAGRVLPQTVYPRQVVPFYGREQSVQIYLPSRSAQVLAPLPPRPSRAISS